MCFLGTEIRTACCKLEEIRVVRLSPAMAMQPMGKMLRVANHCVQYASATQRPHCRE